MTDKAAVSIGRVHAEPASEHTACRGVAAPLSPLDPGTLARPARSPSTTSPCFDRSSPEPELLRSAAAIEWEAAPGSLVLLLVHGSRQGSRRQPVRGSWHTEERRQSDLEDGRDDTDVLTSYLRRVPLLALYRAARTT
jgi:hypothetical protein